MPIIYTESQVYGYYLSYRTHTVQYIRIQTNSIFEYACVLSMCIHIYYCFMILYTTFVQHCKKEEP